MKTIMFVFAWFFVALGFIGAFLPILPTTPFLLLAALLFSKSSPRFYAWLVNLPVAGEGIRDWQNDRVIRLKAKILCTLMILLSLILINLNLKIYFGIRLFLSLILISVWGFVVTRKSQS